MGSSLSPQGPNSSWPSASGLFAFGFYKQGNDDNGGYAIGVFIAGIPQKTAVWTANRDNNPVVSENSTLILTTDGKLQLLQGGGQEQNKSVLGTLPNPSDSIATASMLDSGNFVLYNSVQSIIWQSFDYATNSILPGQNLLAEKQHELISSATETDDSKGNFLLKMQLDGYLVQYPVGTPFSIQYAYWQPLNAPGLGDASSLNLDTNGRLYLSNSTFSQDMFFPGSGENSSTSQKLYLAKVDVDGIFRLYSHTMNQQRGNWTKEWESLADGCAPKGICGFNSYCVSPGTECECLPGFDFANQMNKKLGCVRSSIVERCNKQQNDYEFIPSENIEWVASPYAVSVTRTRAECQDACRDDCNCQVVFHDGRNCTMQKLPLRFGRRNMQESSVALIKVSKNNHVVDDDNGGNTLDKTTTLVITKKKEVRLDILIPSVSFFTVSVIILIIFGVLIHKRRVWEYKLIAESKKVHLNDHEAPQAFTYAELQGATNDFKEKLGEGAFGQVYKGFLQDRQKEIAVKRLENVFSESGAEMEFQNELRTIGKTHHRNLVRLLGFCTEGKQRVLVYEYMSNGSLANLLFEKVHQNHHCLSFKERIVIAIDIARGILYLHEECETQIIHCDIKPQNILLDKHWKARISDFGLAKLLNYDQTKTYTAIRGTKGYVAPEWHKRMPVTVKADVYSYGIVLLEILCCRRNIETNLPEDEIVLEYLAYNCFETGNLQKLVRDEDQEEVDKTKLERMVKIAIWCIQDDPSLRPSIKKVMLMLEGTVDIPTPPSPTSILSTI